jgi:hypothetical protein
MSRVGYDGPKQRFVIRDSRFSLCIREAHSAQGALLAFLADKLAADGRIAADTLQDDGDVALTYCRGMRYTAEAVPS